MGAAISPVTAMLTTLVAVLASLSMVVAAAVAESSSGNKNLTAYEALEGYGFPIGLLPKGVLGYELDSSTGKFSVHLNSSCSFSLQGSYDIKYKSTITGYVTTNKIQGLSGISVKVLLFWLNIVQITVDGADLNFSVGITSANFAASNFVECAQCGCGFDCVSVLSASA